MSKSKDMIFLDGSHCKCSAGDLVLHERAGQEPQRLRVVNTHGKPKEGKAPMWWIRHCESYGDLFTKIEEHEQ